MKTGMRRLGMIVLALVLTFCMTFAGYALEDPAVETPVVEEVPVVEEPVVEEPVVEEPRG